MKKRTRRATSPPTVLSLALPLALAVAMAPGSVAAASPAASGGRTAVHPGVHRHSFPAGYFQQASSSYWINPGRWQLAMASCPSGDVPLGGGVEGLAANVGMSINTSFPDPTSGNWVFIINDNTTDLAEGYTVSVVCASAGALPGYQMVTSNASIGPDSSNSHTVACPLGTVAIGGGVSAAVNVAFGINSSTPDTNPLGLASWTVGMSNGSSFTQDYTVYALCADAPDGYTIRTGGPRTVAPGNYSTQQAYCPSDVVAVSGGVETSMPANEDNVFMLDDYVWGYEGDSGWDSWEVDGEGLAISFETVTVCA